MLEHFLKSAVGTTSSFQEKKTWSGPSVTHAEEVVEFSSAKKAIDRDLGYLLDAEPSQAANIVYSVHYSDINGLSRLENNILAHEISEYLGRKA